jgi:demethylspheroidene O-methyltransferase
MPPDTAPAAAFLPAVATSRANSVFSIPSIVARPAFRRWAARFFLTRPIARKQAAALFDLCAGFVYAQILQACLQLDVFTILAEAPLTADALAARVGLTPPAALRLIEAAIALKLLRRQGNGLVSLGMLGAALVENEGIAAMVAHHTMFYADMADPVALLRGDHPTELGRYWAYAGAAAPAASQDGAIAPYTALMAASQGMVADEILDAYPVRRHACLMDVGGGDGMFLTQAAKRAPRLQLRLFDLPAVSERATARFAKAELLPRTQVFGGSFLHDSLPKGADLISLVRVAHDHDDEAVLTLLRAAHGRDTGRRTHGPRLFRLLPARHGQRPAAQRRHTDRDAPRKRVRPGARRADPHTPAGQRADCTSCLTVLV